MKLYSIWMDLESGAVYDSSYQDWTMGPTYLYLTEFNEYAKFQHTLGIL